MAIIAKAKGDFKPAPQGTWPAVCVDVVDLGIVKPKNPNYNPSHQIQFRWILDAEPPLENGQPYMASRRFGLTLGKKSNLKPFIEAWRGKVFTEDELDEFDVETMIGVSCQLQIIHNRVDGVTYGNVSSIVPLGKGMAKMEIPKDYIRQYIRDERAQLEANPDGNGNSEGEYEATDEDIPY